MYSTATWENSTTSEGTAVAVAVDAAAETSAVEEGWKSILVAVPVAVESGAWSGLVADLLVAASSYKIPLTVASARDARTGVGPEVTIEEEAWFFSDGIESASMSRERRLLLL